MRQYRLPTRLLRVMILLLLWALLSGVATTTSLQASRPGALPERLGALRHPRQPPQLSIDPYISPQFSQRMAELRPAILAAAARHNRPEISGMSAAEFAEVMALILYNEQNGWVEDDIEPLRVFTPLYEQLQRQANLSGLGSNFSVRPANLRPSVALEILRYQVPVAGPARVITVPLAITGSRIDPRRYRSEHDLLAAITAEISDDRLAVEYLAANLERGVYRAAYEGAPISWRTLAAWHNQGIVQPAQIRTNPTARDYVRRAAAYLPSARMFIRQ